MYFRVASVIFTIASVVMAGIFFTAALVLGHDDAKSVWLAIAAGLAVSIPVTFMATSSLIKFTSNNKSVKS